MSTQRPSVGKEIIAFCSKCKLDLAHMIVAMKDNLNIHKVMCKTCKSTHSYKNKDVLNVVGKKSIPRKTRTTTFKSLSEEWSERVSSSKISPKKYSIKECFKTNDLVDHPKFGIGFVEKCIDQNKIEVIFQSEMKILIHNK